MYFEGGRPDGTRPHLPALSGKRNFSSMLFYALGFFSVRISPKTCGKGCCILLPSEGRNDALERRRLSKMNDTEFRELCATGSRAGVEH